MVRILSLLFAGLMFCSQAVSAAPQAPAGDPSFSYTMPEDPCGVPFFDGFELGVTTLPEFVADMRKKGAIWTLEEVKLPPAAAGIFHQEIQVEARKFLTDVAHPRYPVRAIFLDNRLVRLDFRPQDIFAFNVLLKTLRESLGDPDEEDVSGYLRAYADLRSRDYWMVFRTFYDPRTTFYIADELAEKDIRPLKRKVLEQGFAPQEFYCGEAIWQNQSAALSFACPRSRHGAAPEMTFLHRRLNDRLVSLELIGTQKK